MGTINRTIKWKPMWWDFQVMGYFNTWNVFFFLDKISIAANCTKGIKIGLTRIHIANFIQSSKWTWYVTHSLVFWLFATPFCSVREAKPNWIPEKCVKKKQGDMKKTYPENGLYSLQWVSHNGGKSFGHCTDHESLKCCKLSGNGGGGLTYNICNRFALQTPHPQLQKSVHTCAT